MPYNFNGKTALITGASRGLGYFLALELAKSGCHIIAVARTVGGLEQLDDEVKAIGASTTLVPLNLLHQDKLEKLGPSLYPRFPKLDLFLANAAYLGGLSPIEHFKSKEWDKVFSTNLTANFILMKSLAPLLKSSDQALAAFLTDQNISGKEASYWGPYCASKAGLERLVGSFYQEMKDHIHKSVLLSPSPMATNLRRKAFPGEDQSQLTQPQQMAQKMITKLAKDDFENGALLKF